MIETISHEFHNTLPFLKETYIKGRITTIKPDRQLGCVRLARTLNLLAVAATSFFDAERLKRYISYYEKYILRSHENREKQNKED